MKYKKDLSALNTMRIRAKCLGVVPVYTEQNVYEVLVEGLSPLKVIGGGSNILITRDQNSYILKNEIKGIDIIDEDDNAVIVRVGGGENWHQFVMWCISHHLGGLENLALIPGCVGAAPMQNIGAYGVEQVDCFHSLTAIDLQEGVSRTFHKTDCLFGYRDSIFKQEAKDRYIITHVTYQLSKSPEVKIEYGAIRDHLKASGITDPSIRDVADAVIRIRQSKLPDPEVLPNTGSFFKNPIITREHLKKLTAQYPDIVSYPVDADRAKVPAAWLIERCGYKGKRVGDAATHQHHALVLVNHGHASGDDMLTFAHEIQSAVRSTFDIEIYPEVNIW